MSKELQTLRDRIAETVAEIHKRYFELAELLHKVKFGEYYKEWGYETFEDYCEFELKISRRKGYYLVMLWDTVKSLPKEAVGKFKRIGDWTKAVQVARVLKYDYDNYNKWIDEALRKSYNDLVVAVNERLRELGTEGGVTAKKVENLYSFNAKLYESEYEMVINAIDLAKKISGTEATGHALAMMAMDFLASRSNLSDGEFLTNLLNFIENLYNCEILAFRRFEDGSVKILYGENKSIWKDEV